MNYEINASAITHYLQSRYPFLMIDWVESVTAGEKALGYKNLSVNEWCFNQKNIKNQIFPQSLQLEAMEEMLIIAIRVIDKYRNSKTRFLSVDAIYHRDVHIGEKLDIQVYVKSWKRGILSGVCKTYVDKEISCEAKMKIAFPEIMNDYLPNR